MVGNETRAGEKRLAGRLWLCGASLVVLLGLAGPAWCVTVDGLVSPSDEWDDAGIHLIDAAPEPPIPAGYDVTDIYLKGGSSLFFRTDVEAPPIEFKRHIYLRFDFSIAEDPGAGYSISINDGLGLPRDAVHLVRFEDWNHRGFNDKQHLGEGTLASGDVFESAFDWSLFPEWVRDGNRITLGNYSWMLESGPTTLDDGGEGVFSPASPILIGPQPLNDDLIPEPMTLVGLVLGCGMLGRRVITALKKGN
jgi:hypothetical protein